MSRTDSTIRRRLALAAAALVLASCGGDDPKPGSIRFALTDAAGCGFDQVNVTVDRIRVHRSADAAATAAGWSELRLQPARRIDLLQLTNGVLVELGSLSVPASRFANLRLVLAANGSGTPANSVVADGVETALTLPADATASGIRVATQVTVEANRVSDLLLDFDACRSVVPSGATYLLQPVVTAVPRHGAVISGYVPTQMAGARVSAQKNGLPQRSTVADGNGRFVLAFLDPAQSPFDVVVVAAGRAAAVVAAVRSGRRRRASPARSAPCRRSARRRRPRSATRASTRQAAAMRSTCRRRSRGWRATPPGCRSSSTPPASAVATR